mgnify:CR=1 FL=1
MNVLCSGYSFFWKKVRKKFGTGALMFLSLQPQSGTDVLNKRRRWEGMMCWLTGFYVVQSSSGYCPGRVLKKTSKISFKKFGSNEKVLTFAAAFRNEADVLKHFDWCVFHLLRMKPAEAFFYGGSEKKVWKKVRKDLEGICKSIYLCIRFRLISGVGKREAKRVLKDIERFENKQQVRVREEIQRI